MGNDATLRYATIAVFALAGLLGCGNGDGSSGGGGPTGPSAPSGSAPGPSGATITATNNTISPSTVSVSAGQSVTFVNNDTRSHHFASDPHPTHGSCPSIDALGPLGAGQTRLTNAFAGTGTCTFHDHENPDTAGLKGTITVR